MAGPREDMFAAIQAQLESISIANGYTLNVGRVFRAEFLTDQLVDGDFPALFVLESLAGDQLKEQDPAGYEWWVNFTIAGVIRYGQADLKDPARHTELNALINATWRALLQDPTFDSTCKDSILQGGPAMVDTERAEGIFNMGLRCHSWFQRSDL